MKKEHVFITAGLFLTACLFLASFAFVVSKPGIIIMGLYPWLIGSFFAVLCDAFDSSEEIRSKEDFAWTVLKAFFTAVLGPVLFAVWFSAYLYKELKKLD